MLGESEYHDHLTGSYNFISFKKTPLDIKS